MRIFLLFETAIIVSCKPVYLSSNPDDYAIIWNPYTAAQEITCAFKYIPVQTQFIFQLISYLWNGQPALFTPYHLLLDDNLSCEELLCNGLS